MGVKIYGSNDFTPADLPSGTTLERAPFTTIWAGCLGTPCEALVGGQLYSYGIDNPYTAWSWGGYGSSELFSCENCHDCNTAGGPGCMPASLQDQNQGTGWNSFLNGNAGNKRVMASQVGVDLPGGTVITYVRIWVRAGSFEGGTKFLQPFWQNKDQSGSGDFAGISSQRTWDPGIFQASPSTYGAIQVSSKWIIPPYGGIWTKEQMANLAWGVRHGYRGDEGNPRQGTLNIPEMAVEVGYESALQYSVTTGPALGVTGTQATLTGTVNPFGDPTGSFYFQYGTTTGLGSATGAQGQPSASEYSVSVDLLGLMSDTTYYYRLVAVDSTGGLHFGETLSFLTVSACSTRASLVGG
jgi:hypothetical protein